VSEDVQRDTINAVKRWLAIRGKPGDSQIAADIDHSALLKRLLAGQEPLPQPPPRALSSPWYDLIETGHGTAMDVVEYTTTPGMLSVNQSGQWKIVEKRADGSYVARCTTNNHVFTITLVGERYGHSMWELQRVDE